MSRWAAHVLVRLVSWREDVVVGQIHLAVVAAAFLVLSFLVSLYWHAADADDAVLS